jgi:hypothetical protein
MEIQGVVTTSNNTAEFSAESRLLSKKMKDFKGVLKLFLMAP